MSAFEKDVVLRPLMSQLVRSGMSIGANIEEGKGAHTRKDLTNFFQISYKSTNETQYWLDVLKEYGVANNETNIIEAELLEFRKILASSLKTLRKG